MRRIGWLRGALILAAAVVAGPAPSRDDAGWLNVDYAQLIDRRRLTHSGEPLGVVLDRLGGRALPGPGERLEDLVAYRLLDPLLEPYAFVLADALDAQAPPHDPPLVEVGGLWEPGAAQPAWVELARARRLLLESDGLGHLRVCLPIASIDAQRDLPEAAAKSAWNEAWPILRHALAAERRRLARAGGGTLPTLDVEVHAYKHLLAQSKFLLGVTPWRTKVAETGPTPGTRTLELGTFRAALERGFQVEGARLEPSGRLRLLLGDPDKAPAILGRPPTLADLAVAYRAVARGGFGEPYMSLDRAIAPQIADVNYGGRLRDTALGMVSLLSDVRFKTFSLGIDLLGAGDVRESIRSAAPGFRTHLERFAGDPTAGSVLNQQTRFWFYPDGVELTVSAEGDVLAFRRVRMSAASERVRGAGDAAADPPWTRETVAYLNAHYEELSSLFPEMADLDESVRWLSVFTWLEAARERGLRVPDLDALLALELPAVPTPRRFPQLLSYDVLPPPGAAGLVDVIDRTEVGVALSNLEPANARPLPAARRFRRALSQLDRRIPDQASLAKEMEAAGTDANAVTLDLLSFRAERLLMHMRVLATLPADRQATVDARRSAAPATRVFSIGIGGVDLGTGAIVAKAAGRGSKLALGAAPAAKPAATVSRNEGVATAPAVDPPELPPSEWPDHGLGPESLRVRTEVGDGRGSIVARRRPGSLVRKGTWKVDDGHAVAWDEWIEGMEGPEARSRRRISDPGGAPPSFERVEDGRFLTYRFERQGPSMRAALAVGQLPDLAFGAAAPTTVASTAAAVPSGLTVITITSPAAGVGAVHDDPASLDVRVRDADGRDRTAAMPRALLQRVALGKDVDLTPGRPLPAFMPAAQILGSARVGMLVQAASSGRAPWDRPESPPPGEEEPRRLAVSLTRFWSEDVASRDARAVVGVDPVVSPARWARAPALDGTLAIVAPDDAFPGSTSGLRSGLPASPATVATARLLVVVSAEPPGVLGLRLRALAADPASAGKSLAVVALGGALRSDLPPSLLAEGRLAAFGLYEAGPVGRRTAVDAVARWVRQVTGEGVKGQRAEAVLGPFAWFY